MASRRQFKKEIDYLVGEVISNSYTCLYFHPDTKRDQIVGVIEEAIALRNELFERFNPPEKDNPRLVKKHFAALRGETLTRIDGLFEKLSEVCKK